MDGILIVSPDQGIYVNSQGPTGRRGQGRDGVYNCFFTCFQDSSVFLIHCLSSRSAPKLQEEKINGSPEPHPSRSPWHLSWSKAGRRFSISRIQGQFCECMDRSRDAVKESYLPAPEFLSWPQKHLNKLETEGWACSCPLVSPYLS